MSIDLLSQSRAIAESLLLDVTWTDSESGYCRCPGIDLHPKGTSGKRDCRVFLGGDKPPTIFCVHRNSCVSAVSERNRLLRSSIGKAKWQIEREENPDLPVRPPVTRAELLRRTRQRKLTDLTARFKRGRADILGRPWSVAEMVADSPGDCSGGWRALLALFAPTETVWIGDKKDSGDPRFATHFRSARAWLDGDLPAGPLLSAAAWKPGSFRRSENQILRSPFLVVESDELDREQIGAVFRWFHDDPREPLTLRAIIDTGGKGLHGWFDRPTNVRRLEERQAALVALGCDPGPMRPASMSRLPDAWREDRGRHQRLLWINPSGGEVEHFST